MHTSVRDYQESDNWKGYRAAVSLHSHTHHSREMMSNLPRYIVRIPLVGLAFEREVGRYHERAGHALDFSRGWWHPPVCPRGVFESEAEQIERRFGLYALVSVTDHDDIQAGLDLQELYANRRAPISFEWTVPFGSGFFHVGVHNLPACAGQRWFDVLSGFTARSTKESLSDILTELNRIPDVLLVLCHPLWDLADVGQEEHLRQLGRFLRAHRAQVHAVELNGYRAHKENSDVRTLGLAARLPLISGGDRHGRAPNAVLNVTRARSFAEFVHEIRDGASEVILMPEYRQNLTSRKLASASDVLKPDESHRGGRVHWTDRVTWERDGNIRPLSFHWPDGGPLWVRSTVQAFRLIANPVMLPVVGAALDTVRNVRYQPDDSAGVEEVRAS